MRQVLQSVTILLQSATVQGITAEFQLFKLCAFLPQKGKALPYKEKLESRVGKLFPEEESFFNLISLTAKWS